MKSHLTTQAYGEYYVNSNFCLLNTILIIYQNYDIGCQYKLYKNNLNQKWSLILVIPGEVKKLSKLLETYDDQKLNMHIKKIYDDCKTSIEICHKNILTHGDVSFYNYYTLTQPKDKFKKLQFLIY